jgi:hypothetical protein
LESLPVSISIGSSGQRISDLEVVDTTGGQSQDTYL